MPRLILTVSLFLTLAATAAAQSTPFSLAATNLNLVSRNSTYTSNISAQGTGTVAGFGTADIRVTASAVRERGLGCSNRLQADITFTFGTNDILTFTVFTNTADLGKPVPSVVTGSAGLH